MAKEMRAVLAQALIDLMEKNDKVVVLDADLANADGIKKVFKAFPERGIDVGISEQNMASVAAGMAATGALPFIVTFTPFATRRICDQVTISIAYAKRNVKIIGTDPGITAELNGGTHMSVEDVGVLRSIPGMVIFEPADGEELARAIPAIAEYDGPVYVRVKRKNQDDVYEEGKCNFDLFKADILREGKDVSLFACGIMVTEALKAAALLAEEGICAEVVNVHTIKPIDAETVAASVKKTGCAVTCDNHNVIGALGSAVAETLAKKYPAPVEMIGMQDRFGQVAKLPFLIGEYQMTAEDIAAAAKKAIARK